MIEDTHVDFKKPKIKRNFKGSDSKFTSRLEILKEDSLVVVGVVVVVVVVGVVVVVVASVVVVVVGVVVVAEMGRSSIKFQFRLFRRGFR